MILLSAVVVGLVVGVIWARWQNRPYRAPDLKAIWLALAAFVPQVVAAYLPATGRLLPQWVAAALLAASFVGFLAFIWINRRLPGMWVLFVGLALNLAVMLANGGWMPISPETASHLSGPGTLAASSLGERFGQKDVLLLPQDMRLPYLSDRFLLPGWSPYQVAFSLGDTFIAAGAFWLLAGTHRDGGKEKWREA